MKPKNENEAKAKVSFWVAHSLVKQRKSFVDSELTISCLIAAEEEMCLASLNLYQMISLLVRTVARRVDSIAATWTVNQKLGSFFE